MGWSGHELPNKEWMIYTRGGTSGVYIKKHGTKEEIDIPSELIRMLVAEDIRGEQISKWEQLETDEVLGLVN